MLSRTEQHRRFVLLLDAYERRLFRASGRAINKINRLALREFQRTGDINLSKLRRLHEDEIEDVLIEHYNVIMPRFADHSVELVSQKMKWKLDMSLVERLLGQWVSINALEQAALISGTTVDNIRRVLQDGINEGLGAAAITRKIATVSGLTPTRSSAIAITETHNAATFASIETVKKAQDDLGTQLYKKWMPTGDERTRQDHRAMLSTPAIPLEDKFMVGGERMDRPGDSTASAKNVVRCRCAIIYEPPNFDIVG